MKRRPLLILFLLLVAGVGVFVWKSSRDARADTFTLADGSVLEFHGFTFGTNHSHCFGNLFQRMAARIPGRLGEVLSGNTLRKAPGSPSTNMVFWFLVRKNPSLLKYVHAPPTKYRNEQPLFGVNWNDDNGNRWPGTTVLALRPLASGDVAAFTYSTNLPSASRTVHMRLSIWRDPADEEVSKEFLVPNPLYRKEP